MTDDIDIPEDTRRSRLPKPHAQVMDEEFVTAWERFAEFREQYPNGCVEATLDRVIEHPDGHVTYVMTAAAYLVRPDFGVVARPDSTGWSQGSTKDDNPVIAGSPIESAETIARSKALKNLGILDGSKPAKIREPRTDEQIGADVATARERAGMSQKELAGAMTERGFKWSQATVSQIEKGERPLRLTESDHLAEPIRFRT
ncbi:helix-turn-helix domain-containing protein [Microbacterium aurugineum]|uniref:helix-turn-helix domain-containing protein n=1 Tax=Microbacterium aurugineum TaxID=2851642 RepID=UPI0020BE67A0|nr:helix-turn-helix transcriptional regulator [Microbacterium aurugineum]MCK8477206.1 helix-turn-helix domain-containing protein [Microbacterium aurugineum]